MQAANNVTITASLVNLQHPSRPQVIMIFLTAVKKSNFTVILNVSLKTEKALL